MGCVMQTCRTMRDLPWRQMLLDEFIVVTVPREVAIQNKRLSILWRISQVALVIALLTYSVIDQVWAARHTPDGYGLRFMWQESNTEMVPELSLEHCSAATLYWFNSSFGHKYAPTGCMVLPMDRAYSNYVESMFLPTYVEEVMLWNEPIERCNTSTCTVSTAGCRCKTQHSYFTKNPELQRISLWHGYQVDTSAGDGLHMMRGSIGATAPLVGSRSSMQEASGELLTRIVDVKGEPCAVGGISEWPKSESTRGISGTLKEWLACAGVALDDDPRKLLPDPSLAPHLRLTGLTLMFHLDYLSIHSSRGRLDVVCEISLEVQAAWTEMPSTTSLAAFKTAAGPVEARRMFRGNGVALATRVTGTFRTFDLTKVMTALVNFIVLFNVPLYFTQFVSLYCLGLVSEIYRRARRTKLNAYHHFQHAVTRNLMGEMAFRGLLGGKFEGNVDDEGLSPSDWLSQLFEMFQEHVRQGVLSQQDLQDMAVLTFKHLDSGGKGTISRSDFMRSTSSHEFFDMRIMARFFSSETSRGMLQNILDNSRARQRSSLHSSAGMEVMQRMSSNVDLMVTARNQDSMLTDDLFSDFGSPDDRAEFKEEKFQAEEDDQSCEPEITATTRASSDVPASNLDLSAMDQRLVALERNHFEKTVIDLEARLRALEVHIMEKEDLPERIRAQDELLREATSKQEALGAAFAELKTDIQAIMKATPRQSQPEHADPALPLPDQVVDQQCVQLRREALTKTATPSFFTGRLPEAAPDEASDQDKACSKSPRNGLTLPHPPATALHSYSNLSDAAGVPLRNIVHVDIDTVSIAQQIPLRTNPGLNSSGPASRGRYSSRSVDGRLRTDQRPPHWMLSARRRSGDDAVYTLSPHTHVHRASSAEPIARMPPKVSSV